MSTTRRTFLMQGGAVTLLASSGTLPAFLSRSAASAESAVDTDRVLVVIQLSGGNDGLNTVVPYENDSYHRARPTLRIDSGRVLRLNDELGLHPNLAGLKGLYDGGELAIVNNVGYPNPDRSHFRSMDIWHTADPESPEDETGWIGRLADAGVGAGGAPLAVQVDDAELPLALRGRQAVAPTITDIDALRLPDEAAALEARLRAAHPGASSDLQFVRRVAVDACRQARRLRSVEVDGAAGTYPGHGLAGRLRQIAALIDAGFGARVYYTSLGGFDTHAQQATAHGPLLRELSESVAAFQADLRRRGVQDRVLTMTFSEFGRRVAENGSRGTDHGAAAPMFLIGAGVQSGLHGGGPRLDEVERGDVAHDVDFRRVYATAWREWLGLDPRPVLGEVRSLGLIRTAAG